MRTHSIRRLAPAGLALLALLFTTPLQAAPATSLIQTTLARLEQIGFAKRNILQKSAKQGSLDFVLVRCRSQRRIFDISLFSDTLGYLTVSYDDGKRFGKLTKFTQISALLDLVERIEKRERAKAPRNIDATSGTADDGAGTANDQRAGLEEAAQREKKERQRLREKGITRSTDGSRLEKLASKLTARRSSGGGSSGDSGGGGGDDAPVASGAAVDAGLRNSGGDFTGGDNNCGGGSEDGGSAANSAPLGGLASAVQQLGEAALAGAIGALLNPGGLPELGKNSTDQNSRFFATHGNDPALAQLLQQKTLFAEGTLEQKQLLLKAVLYSVVGEQDNDYTRQYRSAQERYLRLKAWAKSEGFAPNRLPELLQPWIETLEMPAVRFAALQKLFPPDQRQTFVVDFVKQTILLDPEAPSPDSAAADALTACMLLLKAKALKLDQLTARLNEARTQLRDALDGPFDSSQTEVAAAQTAVNERYAELEAANRALNTLLEENPLVP